MTLNRRSLSELALRNIEHQPLSGSTSENRTRTLTPRAIFALEHLEFLNIELGIEAKTEAHGRRWTEMPKMSGSKPTRETTPAKSEPVESPHPDEGAGLWSPAERHQAAEDPSHVGLENRGRRALASALAHRTR
jgi:hypothetical protein